jgi:hypothetical protein
MSAPDEKQKTTPAAMRRGISKTRYEDTRVFIGTIIVICPFVIVDIRE